MIQRKDLFDFMLKQVKYTADKHGDKMPQAFGRWFANMYFPGVTNVAISDGTGDGKVDLLVTCERGNSVLRGNDSLFVSITHGLLLRRSHVPRASVYKSPRFKRAYNLVQIVPQTALVAS